MKRLFSMLLLWQTIIAVNAAGDMESDDNKAYLAVYMKGTDESGVYYAIADTAFIFEELNDGRPVVKPTLDDALARDPMILCDKKGVYHMVATVSWTHRPFVIWDSDDMITWNNERLVDVAPERSTKTWAPELIYDEETGRYLAYWTAEIGNDWSTAAIYYSSTEDFKNWRAPRKLYGVEGTAILDANITFTDGLYRMMYRMNNHIYMATATHAVGPYKGVVTVVEDNVEGPYLFALISGQGYGLVFDYYGRSSGFGLFTTKDFISWERITNRRYPFYNNSVRFPSGIRHGCILPITNDQMNHLRASFSNI